MSVPSLALLINQVRNCAGHDPSIDHGIMALFGQDAFAPCGAPLCRDLGGVETFVDRLLPGSYWIISKGKQSPKEPLYGAEIWIDGRPSTFDERGDQDAAAEHEVSAALAFLLCALLAIQKRSGSANY